MFSSVYWSSETRSLNVLKNHQLNLDQNTSPSFFLNTMPSQSVSLAAASSHYISPFPRSSWSLFLLQRNLIERINCLQITVRREKSRVSQRKCGLKKRSITEWFSWEWKEYQGCIYPPKDLGHVFPHSLHFRSVTSVDNECTWLHRTSSLLGSPSGQPLMLFPSVFSVRFYVLWILSWSWWSPFLFLCGQIRERRDFSKIQGDQCTCICEVAGSNLDLTWVTSYPCFPGAEGSLSYKTFRVEMSPVPGELAHLVSLVSYHIDPSSLFAISLHASVPHFLFQGPMVWFFPCICEMIKASKWKVIWIKIQLGGAEIMIFI